MPTIYTQDPVGKAIEEHYYGSNGVYTGTLANSIGYEQYQRAQQRLSSTATGVGYSGGGGGAGAGGAFFELLALVFFVPGIFLLSLLYERVLAPGSAALYRRTGLKDRIEQSVLPSAFGRMRDLYRRFAWIGYAAVGALAALLPFSRPVVSWVVDTTGQSVEIATLLTAIAFALLANPAQKLLLGLIRGVIVLTGALIGGAVTVGLYAVGYFAIMWLVAAFS